MSRNIYLISDTHFGHENVLTFVNWGGGYMRKFDSVEDMDDCMVTRWNEVVRDCDIVYHLGDVYFDDGWKQLKKLNGRKRLVLGNHDNGKSKHLQDNFQKITSSRMFREFSAILTHRPIIIPHDDRFHLNIHGHIHYNQSPSLNHVNVSVEEIGYTPIDIELLVSQCGIKIGE